MKRPGKKDIKAAIDALKNGAKDGAGNPTDTGWDPGRLSPKKSSQRIRKQGV
jgi:hypothetical protein